MASIGRPPIPGIWLFTDPRLGDDEALLAAVARLPRGAGVVFRHYHRPPAERAQLAARLWALARRRGLVLLLSAPEPGWRGHGEHRPSFQRAPLTRKRGLISAAAHNRRELLQAFRNGADLVFLSPLFATRSHPDTQPLGLPRFGLAAHDAPGPVIALGGMTPARARHARAVGAAGYAAIDAFGW